MRKADAAKASAQAGFTLLEILLAIALFSIVLVILYSSFFVAERAVRGNEDVLVRLHEARAAMDVIRLEVEAALEAKDGRNPFIVKDRDIFGKQASELEFSTYSSYAAGPSRVSYRVVERQDGLALVKGIRPAGLEDEEAQEAEVIEYITSFSVNALEGERWQQTWQGSSLPAVVKVTVTIPIQDREITLTEAMRPRLGRQL